MVKRLRVEYSERAGPVGGQGSRLSFETVSPLICIMLAMACASVGRGERDGTKLLFSCAS